MKVVDQARLWFKEGRSDKVYEIDLVDVAEGQFVVNFRYGRRGAALRDGTKTPIPTSLDRARAAFDALVDEKVKGGYRPTEGAPAEREPSDSPRPQDERGADLSARLLEALRRGHRGPNRLHLVVRRVGDLGLREAEPMLLELLRSSPPPKGMKGEPWQVVLLSALARCGTSQATALLASIIEGRGPLYVKNAARLALAMVEPSRASELAQSLYGPALPSGVGSDAERLARTLEPMFATDAIRASQAILGLYLIAPENDVARRAVFALARTARVSGAELAIVRGLYRASELRRDGPLFALLARRVERREDDGDTLRYLRRRVARFLRRLGSLGSPEYVPMAAELLTSYGDADAEAERRSSHHWGPFARYHALNFVLYQNSPRFERAHHARATWRSVSSARRTSGAAPSAREEAFPDLWDRAPAELWRVALSPTALPVIEFAARALRAQPAYLAQLAGGELARAMCGAHPLVRALAFEVARTRPHDVELARGALLSGIADAEGWVLDWVRRDPRTASTNAVLLALLATAPGAKPREELVALARTQTVEGSVARLATAQALSILLGLAHETTAGDDTRQRAAGAAATLLRVFPDALDAVGVDVVRDLLAHPVAQVAELGAEMLLRRARAGTLEDGLLDGLIASPHSAVRAIGARIVADTPAELFKDSPDLLVFFALSPHDELRQGTRRAIGDVANRFPEVGRAVAERLLDALLSKQADGVPAHLVSLLRNELGACLPRRDSRSILQLVGALSPHAREAGGILLPQLAVDDLTLEEIIRLANHESLLVRRGACALAEAAKDRFRVAPVALGRLCDARWDDTRAFAFALVETLPLSPDAILSICDSTQPIVQSFGQKLLHAHWNDENAAHYLLCLSEHPSVGIQLLVSGLLATHARGKLEVVRRLLPYFTTVLTQVNRGGVAKERVLEFLRAESVASSEGAALLAPILERQSLTRAVSHRASLIASMVDLHDKHPAVPLPISITEPPVHGSSAGRPRGV